MFLQIYYRVRMNSIKLNPKGENIFFIVLCRNYDSVTATYEIVIIEFWHRCFHWIVDADAIYVRPVSYTHLDVYKRQMLT